LKFETEKTGSVDGYSSTTIDVRFKSASLGSIQDILKLKFSNGKVLNIEISAIGEDIPVYLERDFFDFKVCIFEELYRETLIVKNRGHIAYQCT
jgi:hypothetical protein